MNALNRKVWRDLARIKGQVLAIMAVIAGGVMILILSVNTLQALTLARDHYYQSHQFADLFATLKRAPAHLSERLEEIPGIQQLITRTQAPVRLRIIDDDTPANGLMISLPETGQPTLNRLNLVAGRLPEPNALREVVINETFARAHHLQPGATISAIINGRMETLTVCGIALSPEYIYLIGPGEFMPDYRTYTILWMNQVALARALDMDGAFNSVIATLRPGSEPTEVIATLDEALAPYGGTGAILRDNQTSHRFLQEELDQLARMARLLPTIFLGVSMFLLHVLMGRIVLTQLQQIAVLKAFGYTHRQIAWHYLSLTLLIAWLGSLLGIGLGIWASRYMASIYAIYFQMPAISLHLRPDALLAGCLLASGAALAGALSAVLRAVRLPPATAMRPPAPDTFRSGILELPSLRHWIDPIHRIILRNLLRHRIKTLLSATGIGLAVALLFMGGYQFNAVNFMLNVQFQKIQRMDLTLQFTENVAARVVTELQSLPGVRTVEPFRNLPVRLIHTHRNYLTSLQGLPRRPTLSRLLDARYSPVEIPADGLLLSRYVASTLNVRPGDHLSVEVMTGDRRVISVQVSGLIDDLVGVGVWMEISALNHLLGEGDAYSGAWLTVDPDREAELLALLEGMPRVLSISRNSQMEGLIRQYLEDTMLAFMGIVLVMAGSIAFAVVYNNARIAFTERSRELATLRALGFSFFDVAWILAGDTFLLTALAIPLGWLAGTGFAWLMVATFSSELFRIPFVLNRTLYAAAGLGILATAALSVCFIVYQLKKLDIIEALKTE